ncbi:MAG TPA: FIST N-terminal domain-containing protein [Chthonomonadaceae bacterium]|nr:FIST N-terminal domain-containing protein [Chthonomonadaceae bacterium]
MQFAAAVTRAEDVDEAVQHLVLSLRRQLTGEIDLLAVFLSAHHRDHAGRLSERLRQELFPRVLIGCSCEGVIGGEREIEREPGISVLAGRLPGVTLSPFAFGIEDWETVLAANAREELGRRVGATGASRSETRAYLVMGDPFTTQIVEFMEALERWTPAVPIVGGMASSGERPGQNVLLLDEDVLDEGLVGVRLAGPVRVDTVVSQGCRPIGEPMLVTKAEQNMIGTLGGQNALEAARAILDRLPPEEQARIGNDGLFLGIVINEYQPTFGCGDFLIRSVLGADKNTGAVAVGDHIRAGQTVQFHVRDKVTADEDLRLLMAHAAQDETAPAGGLLFSCNGRGIRLFDLPNHDVRGVLEAMPETPLAGFFAAGEIGPIGGRNFIHGHTASIALFRPDLSS